MVGSANAAHSLERNKEMNKFTMAAMKEAFDNKAPESLTWSHYELHKNIPEFSVDEWKAFLLDPDIKEELSIQTDLMRKSMIYKITAQSDSSKSVGQAQLLSALARIDEASTKKSTYEGPIFIYSYVPLNEEEANAPNVSK